MKIGKAKDHVGVRPNVASKAKRTNDTSDFTAANDDGKVSMTTISSVLEKRDFGGMSWAELVELADDPRLSRAKTTDAAKKTSPLIAAHNGKTRDKGEAEKALFGLLRADLDDATGQTPETIAAALRAQGLESFIVHTTLSSTPENPRFRVYLELAAPVGFDVWRSLQLELADVLGSDPCVNLASQFMTLPTITTESGRHYERLIGEGSALAEGSTFWLNASQRAIPTESTKGGVALQPAAAPQGDLVRLGSALAAIPIEEIDDYDQWLQTIFAIHHESGGSDEGLELAHEFSSRSGKYDPDAVEAKWASVKGRANARTAASIYALAFKHGWREVVVADGDLADDVRPSYVTNNNGDVLVTMDNVTKALSVGNECGMTIGYDAFKDEICKSMDGGVNWAPFRDADYSRLRINLERIGFKPPTKEIVRDAVQYVAERNSFDSAQLWLNRLQWDGVPRVESFFPTYWNTVDNAYTRATGRYLWTALAGRVLDPGCKADMAPVAYGPQGARKSSGVAAIAPDPEFFTEISFGEKDNDISRKMRGRLIAELAELRGLHTKDLESIKAFIARQYEDWTPKFREFNTKFARRLVFFGTTNQQEFLADETGNRRWLPLAVGEVDVDGITRDRLQLWAEGREMFLRGGVDYQEAEKLAAREHGTFMIHDSWEDAIHRWLGTEEAPTDISSAAIFRDVLLMSTRETTRAHEMRLVKAMVALGYEKERKMVKGVRGTFWVKA